MLCLLAPAIVSAQVCTPDPQFTQPGIYPPAQQGLPDAVMQASYSQTVTIVVPDDTTISTFTFNVDSVQVLSVTGLPPNMSYTCAPADCIFDGGSSACILVSGTPPAGSAGNYSLTIATEWFLTQQGGGSSTTTVINFPHSIEVVQAGALEAEAGSPRGVCYTNTTLLGGNPTVMGGIPPYTYAWAPPDNLDDAAIANPTATVLVSDSIYSYTVVVTDDNGATASDTVYIEANPQPPLGTSGDVTICRGEATVISADSADVYEWSPLTGLDNASVPGPEATPDTTTTYTVIGTDTLGCSDTLSVTVFVNPTPSLVLEFQDTTICPDDIIYLGSITNGDTLEWFPTTGLSTPDSNVTLADVTQTTTYTFSATNTFGCFREADVTVTVDPCNGIIEAAGYRAILISPNPAMGKISVQAAFKADITRMVIYDINGGVVLSKDQPDQRALQNIDVSHLSAGVYQLALEVEGQMLTRKLFLQ